jgi:hypothetical protein
MNIKCYDNGGASLDRFTIVYLDKPHGKFHESRAMCHEPKHPCGVSLYVVTLDGQHLGTEVKFEDLPKDCQAIVNEDLTQYEEIDF